MDRHQAVQQPEEGIFVIPKEVFPWTYPRSIGMQSSQFPLCRAHSSALAQLSWLVQKLLVWDSNMYYLSPLDLEEPASSMRLRAFLKKLALRLASTTKLSQTPRTTTAL